MNTMIKALLLWQTGSCTCLHLCELISMTIIGKLLKINAWSGLEGRYKQVQRTDRPRKERR